VTPSFSFGIFFSLQVGLFSSVLTPPTASMFSLERKSFTLTMNPLMLFVLPPPLSALHTRRDPPSLLCPSFGSYVIGNSADPPSDPPTPPRWPSFLIPLIKALFLKRNAFLTENRAFGLRRPFYGSSFFSLQSFLPSVFFPIFSPRFREPFDEGVDGPRYEFPSVSLLRFFIC